MAFKDKVDVIDLIISVLREHESSLDRLVERLEKLNEHLEGSMEEAPLYDEKDREESADLLNYKVQELERRLEKYRGMLKTILDHCERIQDIACVREIADKALEMLDVKADKAMMIGNSLNSDIRGAQNTGLRAIWLNRDGFQHDNSIIPDREIHSLTELKAILL